MDILIIKTLLPAVISFIIGIAITPIVTHYLYKHNAWKKQGGKKTIEGKEASEFNRLKGEGETKTPRMGGIVIWGSVMLTVLILYLLTKTVWPLFSDIFFISRSQTWIPLATLIIGALFGFINDFYDIQHGGTGVRLSIRLLVVSLTALIIGWWFYSKLGVTTVSLPLLGQIYVGWFLIIIFVLLTNFIYASGIIDGIDGLAGGVFAVIFSAYAGIALIQNQFDLAAFCVMVTGAILAFLWFNIPPARFWMTETGTMALTLTLAVVILMTDGLVQGNGLALFPIIGFLLVITVLSNITQLTYRKITGEKLLRIAPLHHHFEAIGWPSHKVTMRYWLISMITAILGVIIATLITL